ncbi:phage antirepressor KilAC domain-containing protein [Paenibacillus thiaminolyticus]|uniref:phage antirepressor KilAC domain-containing protein n=1 Tax=Paenibacillus thiaminolyticus TaxID=49283 RepID=UPI0030B99124
MNQLQVFKHQMFGELRTVEIEGKPFVVGNDVAKSLEYARPYEAVSAHCKGAVKYRVLTNGGTQEVKVIPEGDIYRLIVKAADQSRNPEIKEKAERYERWVFDEVLPSIRKHGAYMTEQTLEEALTNPDFLIDLATRLKEEQQARLAAESQVKQQQPLVQFAETCMSSKNSIRVREMAKLASKNGINIGQNRLFAKLREWGLIMYGSNEPMQRAIDAGWFEVVQGVYQKLGRRNISDAAGYA